MLLIVLVAAVSLVTAPVAINAQSFADFEPRHHNIHIPLPVDPLGVASLAFRCPLESRLDPYCIIGQGQLSLELIPQDTAGFVGLRIRNAGYNLSVVDEIRVLDDSGMLKTDKLYQKRTTGQVHFQRDKVAEEVALSNDADLGSDLKTDIVLVRREEVSRQGRLLRSNGINSDGDESLTLIFRTSHMGYDIDLVHDALKECLLRVSLILTGFDDGPNESRRLSTCPSY